MTLHPLLAIIDAPIIIGILVVGALLFGADKLPKLARSAGQAKKEFLMGQAEADEAAAKAREEARQRAAARARRHHGQCRGRLDLRRSRSAADARPGHSELVVAAHLLSVPLLVERDAARGDVGPEGDADYGAPSGAP